MANYRQRGQRKRWPTSRRKELQYKNRSKIFKTKYFDMEDRKFCRETEVTVKII